MKNDITSLTLCDLVREIRERKLSADEVVRAYLASIDTNDGQINAYITKTADIAQMQARQVDEKISEGEAPVLCGVPFAVKDNFAVSGVPMTCASNMLRDFVPPYNATVYERAVSAGGILLGKTNLDEFAMGSSCERSVFGATKNPLDTTKSAGGSSGGSAAAVAANEAAFAIGSDTGGSARQPAAFCGVCAMKPTYGAVSRYGLTEFASSLDTVCPITKNVRDNAVLLEAIVGRDVRDMTSLGLDGATYTDGIENGVRGLKIALVDGFEDYADEKAVFGVLKSAEILRRLGADVVTVQMPFLREAVEIYLTVSAAEASSNLARYDGIRYGLGAGGESVAEKTKRARSDGFGAEVKRRILTGTFALSSVLTGDYYGRVKSAQSDICRRIYGLFEKIDILLMPTSAGTAFDLGSFDESPTEMYGSDRFTVIANLTGCPAISVPFFMGDSLPVGVMLMGNRLSEGTLYRAAYAVESETKAYCGGIKND